MILNLKNNKSLLAGIIISGIIGAIVLGIVLLFAIAYFKKKERDGKQSYTEEDLETMKKKYKELEEKLAYKDYKSFRNFEDKILSRKDVESLKSDIGHVLFYYTDANSIAHFFLLV